MLTITQSLYLSHTLSRFEVDYGPFGDIYFPIHIVASLHHGEMLECLVTQYGVDINQCTSSGSSPLSIILSSTYQKSYLTAGRPSVTEVANLAIRLGAIIDVNVVRAAVLGMHWDFLQSLILERDVDTNFIFMDNEDHIQTPLQIAIQHNQLELAVLLLASGSEIHDCPSYHWISHPLAFYFFHQSMKRSLDWPNLRDREGNTIAHELVSGKFPVRNAKLMMDVAQAIPGSSTNWKGENAVQHMIASISPSTPVTLILAFLLSHFGHPLSSECYSGCPDNFDYEADFIYHIRTLVDGRELTGLDVCSVCDLDEVTLMDRAEDVGHGPLKQFLLSLL